MRYPVGFFFSNRYDAAKNYPWGGKGGIISKFRNDINIPDGNRSLMIFRIMREVLLAKADGVKSETNLKGRSKTRMKSIIDMDSQEAHIIAYEAESGMSTLSSWLIFNDHS